MNQHAEIAKPIAARELESDSTIGARLTEAFTLQRLGHTDHAQAAYELVLDEHPFNHEAISLLAALHLECERRAEALALLESAQRRRPDDAELHKTLGRLYTAQRRSRAAIASFEQARRLKGLDTEICCGLGVAFAQQCRWEEALNIWKRALRLDSRCEEALARLAELHAQLQLPEIAALYHRRLHRISKQPHQQFKLAACGVGAIPEQAPSDLVSVLFDGIADNFDRRLADLGYRGPELIGRLLKQMIGPPAARLDVLDAGCGTGLCAPVLEPYAQGLEGVDLSGGMLEQARKRNQYDRLVQSDLIAHLQHSRASFDLVVAVDVLVYFGELAAVFQAVAAALRTGGRFVFSVESDPESPAGPGYQLLPNGRYTHCAGFAEDALREAGFYLEHISSETLRHEFGKPVKASLIAAQEGRRDAE